MPQHHRQHRKIGGHRAQRKTTRCHLRRAHQQGEHRHRPHNHALIKPHARHQHGTAMLHLIQMFGIAGVLGNLLGGAAQRFHHPNTAHRLLNAGRKITGEPLNLAGVCLIFAHIADEREHQYRNSHPKNNRERGGCGHHKIPARYEHDHNRGHLHQRKRKPPANRTQIAHGTGEQLPGRPPVKNAQRRPQNPVKKVHAHPHFHRGGRIHDQPPPPIRQRCVPHADQKY